MPKIVFHGAQGLVEGQVRAETNLVVQAGVKRFPHPHLRYGCGMGKCGKCACRVLAGGDALPPPNWKETERLGARLQDGYRLMCQIWIDHDIELIQDPMA